MTACVCIMTSSDAITNPSRHHPYTHHIHHTHPYTNNMMCVYLYNKNIGHGL